MSESATAIENTIQALLAACAPGKTVSPEEVARAIAAEEPNWHAHLGAVRRAAVKLALDGQLVIYRKGKPVDPADFKGVYRLGRPHLD